MIFSQQGFPLLEQADLFRLDSEGWSIYYSGFLRLFFFSCANLLRVCWEDRRHDDC